MINLAGRPKRKLTDLPIRDVSLGHLTLLPATKIPIGHTLRTYDVNLDRPGILTMRRGIAPMCENPVGATVLSDMQPAAIQIATFENATGTPPPEEWTKISDGGFHWATVSIAEGIAVTDLGRVSLGSLQIQAGQSSETVVAGSGPTNIDLGELADFTLSVTIEHAAVPDDADPTGTGLKLYTDATSGYEAALPLPTEGTTGEVGVSKSAFFAFGPNPPDLVTWAPITRIEIYMHDAGTGQSRLKFDNMYVTSSLTGWVAVVGSVSIDAVNFRTYGAGGLLTGALKSETALSGVGSAITFVKAQAVSFDAGEFIGVWAFASTVAAAPTVEVRFFTGAGGADYFAKEFVLAQGDNFLIARKSDFTIAGAPDWASIKKYALTHKFTGSIAGDFIAWSNMYLAPFAVRGLYAFRHPSGIQQILAAAGDSISVFDPALQKFTPLITGLVPNEPVSFQTFNDVAYIAKKSDSTRALYPKDDTLVGYIAGTPAPSAPPALSIQVGGGGLPAGDHDYRYVFYSSITRKEGTPILGTDGLPISTLSGVTATGDAVLHTSLPVSAEAKVTHLRIYRRDAGVARWRRVSKDLDGEVANGAPTYLDVTASVDLGDELDGHPTYLVNSRPPQGTMLAAVGNRLIVAGNQVEQSKVFHSRADTGEQFDLGRAVEHLGIGDNDVITGLLNVDGRSAVSKDRAWHIGTPSPGTHSGFAYLEKHGGREGHGMIGPHAGLVVDKVVWYRSRDASYRMDMTWDPRPISEGWRGPSRLPGLIEPGFDDLSSVIAPEFCFAAYNEARAQAMWTEGLVGDSSPSILTVYHMGYRRSLRDKGPNDAWAFHRPAAGNILAGLTCLATYVDDLTGKTKVMAGGPGGFVYTVDTDELDDVLVSGRVAIDEDVLYPFGWGGIAYGHHHIKDYVAFDALFEPMGNYLIDVTGYFDLDSVPAFTAQLAQMSADEIAALADPTGYTYYGEAGKFTGITLPAGLHRHLMIRMRNNRLGEAFSLIEMVLYTEWLGGQGAEKDA